MERGTSFADARPPRPVEPPLTTAPPPSVGGTGGQMGRVSVPRGTRLPDGLPLWSPTPRRRPCSAPSGASPRTPSRTAPSSRLPAAAACSAARICCATGTRSASLGKDLAGRPSEDRSSMGQVVSPFHVERRAGLRRATDVGGLRRLALHPVGRRRWRARSEGDGTPTFRWLVPVGATSGWPGVARIALHPLGRHRGQGRVGERLLGSRVGSTWNGQLSPSRGGMPTHHPICSAPWAGTAV